MTLAGGFKRPAQVTESAPTRRRGGDLTAAPRVGHRAGNDAGRTSRDGPRPVLSGPSARHARPRRDNGGMALTATEPPARLDPGLLDLEAYEVVARPLTTEAAIERAQRWSALLAESPPPVGVNPTSRKVWAALLDQGPLTTRELALMFEPAPRQHRPGVDPVEAGRACQHRPRTALPGPRELPALRRRRPSRPLGAALQGTSPPEQSERPGR